HHGDSVQDRLFRRRVTGQHLGGIKLPATVERDVGEGAADIGTKTNPGHAFSFSATRPPCRAGTATARPTCPKVAPRIAANKQRSSGDGKDFLVLGACRGGRRPRIM